MSLVTNLCPLVGQLVMHNESIPADTGPAPRSVHSAATGAVEWFAQQVKKSLSDNLVKLAVYGPVVTPSFDAGLHYIHPLVIVQRRDVDQLLELAKHSRPSAAKHISPPLIFTEQAMLDSRDVFPLEWLDIAQFHTVILGDPLCEDLVLKPSLVRLQCERELRSLDILLQRGVLATGGDARRMDRLERGAADTMVRVLRGIAWLVGKREPLLPTELCSRCEEAISFAMPGWSQAIQITGRHDVPTMRAMLDELGRLSQWINSFQAIDP